MMKNFKHINLLHKPNGRVAALWLVGLTSLGVYGWGLIRPFNLFTLDFKPGHSIYQLTTANPLLRPALVLTIALLAGLYYLAWRLCRRQESRALWIALLGSVLLINLAMLWFYPIGATDVFDYIMRGRITAEYGGNPFYDLPNRYPADPFYDYAGYHRTPSAYGPLWEALAAVTARLAGDGLLANVLAFKLLSLLFYAGCIFLIAAILRRHASERTLQGVCLFALNPLAIYETAGNAHNDTVMVFWVLLGVYCLSNGRFTLALLALTTGALVKFIPILLVPVAVIAALRLLPSWKSRLHFLIVTGLACVLLIVIVYAPFWRGGDPLGLERRSQLFTTSLPTLVYLQLQEPWGKEASQQIVARAALALTGVAVAAAVWRTWVEKDWLSPIRAMHFILLFCLLFTCLWFHAWYVLWPLTLAAILPEGEAGRTTVLFSYTVFWKFIIFDFFLRSAGPIPPLIVRESILGPATLGIVWFYGLYAAFLKWHRPFLMKVTTITQRYSMQ
jgi:hypothetical protein